MITFFLAFMMVWFFVVIVDCLHAENQWDRTCAYWSLFWFLVCVFLIIAVNNGFVFVQYTVTLPFKVHE